MPVSPKSKIELNRVQKRQKAILKLFFDSHSVLSCSEIYEALKDRDGIGSFHKRTIQRDMEVLSQKYDLAEKQTGRAKIWTKKQGATLPYVLHDLDDDAAAAFLIAEQQLVQLLPASVLVRLAPWFYESRALLEASDPGEDPWYERVVTVSESFPMEPPSIKPEVIEAVYKALRKKCQLKIAYCNRSGQEKTHTVNPEGLISARKTLYLAATLGDFEHITTFALHRVQQAEVKEYDEADLLEEGSFHEHVQEEFLTFYRSDEPIPLVADFHPNAAVTMQEYRLAKDQVVEKLEGGWLRVKATIYDTDQLRTWLLGYGPLLKVVGPESLRNHVKEALKQAAENYND